MRLVNDTYLKQRIGLGETPAQNKKFYDWKRREHLNDLIILAKKGLLYEQIVSDDLKAELEAKFIKI